MKLRIFLSAAVMVIAGLLAPAAFAQSGETPATLAGAKTVGIADVKALLGKAVIVDVRRRASFAEGRLPGAKSAVAHYDAEKKVFALAAFGPDKAAPVVIYGHGSDGWSAVRAVNSAVAGGYTNVNWMRSGWAAWTAGKMPIEE